MRLMRDRPLYGIHGIRQDPVPKDQYGRAILHGFTSQLGIDLGDFGPPDIDIYDMDVNPEELEA